MTSIPFTVGDFEYSLIDKDSEEEAISVISMCSFKYDVLMHHYKIPLENVKQFYSNILDNRMGRETSVMCRHIPTQKICGGFLNNIICPGYEYNYYPHVLEVFGDGNLYFASIAQQALKPDLEEHLFQYILGVDEQYSGNQIGYNLFLASLEMGKRYGIKLAISFLGSPISQHIGIDKLGYTVLYDTNFSDYERDGIRIYEGVKGNVKIVSKAIE